MDKHVLSISVNDDYYGQLRLTAIHRSSTDKKVTESDVIAQIVKDFYDGRKGNS